jgi:hypothetical protein
MCRNKIKNLMPLDKKPWHHRLQCGLKHKDVLNEVSKGRKTLQEAIAMYELDLLRPPVQLATPAIEERMPVTRC